MSCYCGLPLSFARHHWLVVNDKGKLARWEVLIQKNIGGRSWGHLHCHENNAFKPVGLFSIFGKAIRKSDVLGFIEGEEGSTALRMVKFIENSPEVYPHCEEYRLTSPNSNSYVQWVLNHFPEMEGGLPWNAFGKGYNFGV